MVPLEGTQHAKSSAFVVGGGASCASTTRGAAARTMAASPIRTRFICRSPDIAAAFSFAEF
jgi:hypothetical protein